MKFLFITARPLIPNNAGNTVRTYNLMKWLKSNGHYVAWISFVTDAEQEHISVRKKELNIICDKFVPIHYNRSKSYFNCIKAVYTGKPFKAEFYNFKSANEIIKNELKNDNYDCVSGYLYLTSQFVDFCTSEIKWLDLVDSISMLYERQIKTCSNLFKKLFLLEEKRRVLKVEKHSIEKFNFVTMISDIDKRYLSKYTNADDIFLIKNGVDIDKRESEIYNPNQIAYLGDMAYIQNHDAAIWFIDNVLPQLKETNPKIVFKIIGKSPKQELYEHCKDNENVIITGFVEDVKKELMESCLLVCPIKISSGLQNKVLEAMSVGVPAIVTPQVALPITSDTSILLQANKPEDWLNMINNLLMDKQLRKNMSNKSKQFIVENFSWEYCFSELGNKLQEVKRQRGV